MLPNIESRLMSDFEYEIQPSRTYKLDVDRLNIKGNCDSLIAIKQAIYKILNTERYESIIYSWNYGIELKDLYGKPIDYVIPQLKMRIEEALTQDDRIENVDNFEFSKEYEKLITTFTVHTNKGDINEELEVIV